MTISVEFSCKQPFSVGLVVTIAVTTFWGALSICIGGEPCISHNLNDVVFWQMYSSKHVSVLVVHNTTIT